MPLLETIGSGGARGFGLNSAGVLPFPSDISGLSFRLDASNTSSFSLSGSSVNSWTATTGSGTFSQGNASFKPVLQTVSGKQGVYFDGTSDTLVSTTNFSPQYFTVIYASQISVSGMLMEQTADANSGGFYTYNLGNTALVRVSSATSGFNVFDGWQNSGAPTTLMHRYDGTDAGHQIWKNNSQLGAGTSGTNPGAINTSGQLYLMSRGQAGLYAQGYLFEVLFYNRALTNTEATRVHQYLMSKWG